MKNAQDARYSVVELCLALGVSRSGFYDHEQKPDCERRREDEFLVTLAGAFVDPNLPKGYGPFGIRQTTAKRCACLVTGFKR
jgi:hypothetical protein